MDWSTEEISERYFELLPELLTAVNTRKNTKKALRIVFTSIVPVARVNCLEEFVFSEFCSITSDYYYELLNSIEKLLISENGNKSDDDDAIIKVKDTLNNCLDVIQCMEECTSYLTSIADVLEFTNVKSAITCVTGIIESSYRHCQISSTTYGNLFQTLSLNLSSIFKKSFDLQSNLLELLEGLEQCIGEGQNGENFEILAKVVDKLVILCDVVSSLDGNAAVGSWKFIFKVCTTHRSEIQDEVDLESIVRVLCRQVVSVVEEFDRQQLDSRQLKFLDFKLRILVAVTAEYEPILGVTVDDIVQLICRIKEFLHLKIDDPDKNTIFLENFAVATEPLVLHLAKNSRFLDVVTHTGDDGRNAFGKLLILLTLMQSADWMPPDSSDQSMPTSDRLLLRSTFHMISYCHIHLNEPLKISHCPYSDRPDKTTSLYEEVFKASAIHLIRMMSGPLDIEEILLENVLLGDPYNSMLASDLWCFLARVWSTDTCCQHFSILLSLLEKAFENGGKNLLNNNNNKSNKKINSNRGFRTLRSLIRRMFNLLPASYQMSSYQNRPILWTVVSLPSIGGEFANVVTKKIQETCQVVANFVNNVADYSSGVSNRQICCRDVEILIQILMTLERLSKSLKPSDEVLPKIFSTLSSLFQIIYPSMRSHALLRNKVISTLLKVVASATVATFESSSTPPIACCRGLLEILENLISFLKTEAVSKIKSVFLSSANLLESLSFHRIQMCEKELIPLSASLLACSLSLLDDLLMRQISMETFTNFAARTVHKEVISLCVQSDPGIKDAAVGFLQKIHSDVRNRNAFRRDHFEERLRSCFGSVDEHEDDDVVDDKDGGLQQDVEVNDGAVPNGITSPAAIDNTKDPKNEVSALVGPESTKYSVDDLLSSLERDLESLEGIVQSGRGLNQDQKDRLLPLKEILAKLS